MRLEYPCIEGNGEIYLKVLKAICGDTEGKSMVDLMCYHAPYTPQLGFSEKLYVDIQDRGLDFKEEQINFICDDVFNFMANNCIRWDVAICSDGIEHLTPIYRNELWWGMVGLARKPIVFAPIGEVNISDDNHPDSHKSAWYPDSIQFNGCAKIVFPDFHKQLNHGAFFTWWCQDIKEDFERVKNELKNLI